MAIVSYRIRCDDCDAEDVIVEDDMADSPWKVNNKYQHSGLCPSCNPVIDVEDTDFEPELTELDLLDIDNIGKKAASNLSRKKYDTVEAVREAEDDDLLDIRWVGEKAVFSLKEAARAHEPQQRWEN